MINHTFSSNKLINQILNFQKLTKLASIYSNITMKNLNYDANTFGSPGINSAKDYVFDLKLPRNTMIDKVKFN